MADILRVYNENELEYKRLEMFADFTNMELTEKGDVLYVVTVEDMYFDFGQDWKYTGLLTTKANESSWQSLCPRDWELVITTDSTQKLQEMAKWYANKLINNGSWRDVLYEVFKG